MAEARVRFTMTATMEVSIDPIASFDTDQLFKNEQPTTIEEATKAFVEGYLDNPCAFVENEDSKVEIKFEVIGEC